MAPLLSSQVHIMRTHSGKGFLYQTLHILVTQFLRPHSIILLLAIALTLFFSAQLNAAPPPPAPLAAPSLDVPLDVSFDVPLDLSSDVPLEADTTLPPPPPAPAPTTASDVTSVLSTTAQQIGPWYIAAKSALRLLRVVMKM
jgi:hypothetical protein